MKLPRRNVLRLAAGAAVLPVVSRSASALDYPTRPVHFLVGFAPGGILDIVARLIAQQLSKRLGQQVIVENRVGAGSNIATELVAKAQPDGYTLLESSAVNSWNTAIYDHLNFDFLHDLAPVASIARGVSVMEVTPTFPAKTVPEFIAYAKAHPGKINLAAAGPGSGPHLWGELFKAMAGVDLVTVQYHGSGPALPDLMSGRADVMFDPTVSSIGYIRAGRLRPLGVTGPTRIALLPDVPPIADFVPGYVGTGWQGISAPAKTSPEIITIINRAINESLADPEFRAQLLDLGAEPFATSPAEFGKFIVEYTDKWAKVIHNAGIKAE